MRLGRWHIWLWERITRSSEAPYLIRLTVLKCPLFAVMLHWFVGDDDVCLHDHPAPFLSLILRGGYFEDVPATRPYRHGDRLVRTWHPAGSLLRRPAKWVHRITLARDRGRQRPATTLIVMGPKERRWWFHGPMGWVSPQEHDDSRC